MYTTTVKHPLLTTPLVMDHVLPMSESRARWTLVHLLERDFPDEQDWVLEMKNMWVETTNDDEDVEQ